MDRTENCSFSPSPSAHLPFTTVTCACTHAEFGLEEQYYQCMGNMAMLQQAAGWVLIAQPSRVWRREGDCLCSKPRLDSLAG